MQIENFTGERAPETNFRAERLWIALRDTMHAEVALEKAKERVPDYTGQWEPADYYTSQQDAYNRAKENFYRVVMETCGADPDS